MSAGFAPVFRFNFSPVPTRQLEQLAPFFDFNRDGGLNRPELQYAGSLFNFYSFYYDRPFGTNYFGNLSNTFRRLSQELEVSNPQVDLNQDGRISYVRSIFGNSTSELNLVARRNNPFFLETRDLGNIAF